MRFLLYTLYYILIHRWFIISAIFNSAYIIITADIFGFTCSAVNCPVCYIMRVHNMKIRSPPFNLKICPYRKSTYLSVTCESIHQKYNISSRYNSCFTFSADRKIKAVNNGCHNSWIFNSHIHSQPSYYNSSPVANR